jgi:hypothetical protein
MFANRVSGGNRLRGGGVRIDCHEAYFKLQAQVSYKKTTIKTQNSQYLSYDTSIPHRSFFFFAEEQVPTVYNCIKIRNKVTY